MQPPVKSYLHRLSSQPRASAPVSNDEIPLITTNVIDQSLESVQVTNMGQSASSTTDSAAHDSALSAEKADIKPCETAGSVDATKSKLKSKFFITDDVTKAEILWALKAVVSHFSYNSAGDLKELWMTMFPDSMIAKNLSIGSTKIAYVVTHGLSLTLLPASGNNRNSGLF